MKMWECHPPDSVEICTDKAFFVRFALIPWKEIHPVRNDSGHSLVISFQNISQPVVDENAPAAAFGCFDINVLAFKTYVTVQERTRFPAPEAATIQQTEYRWDDQFPPRPFPSFLSLVAIVKKCLNLGRCEEMGQMLFQPRAPLGRKDIRVIISAHAKVSAEFPDNGCHVVQAAGVAHRSGTPARHKLPVGDLGGWIVRVSIRQKGS
jgi:hypothetical protein